ncbi:MAG: hypothetical protein R6W87_12245 [Halospina sp.]
MESPARAALLVAVTLGLSGCFESQKDETFEDTVFGDDVDVRVLHAVTDAPALRLEADGEVRAETLDYGKVATFTLPAHHYRFEAAGYTGREAPEPLLENLEGNLSEGKRHDLLLAGSLADDSARAILLEQDDEPFDPEDEEDEEENGDEEGDDEADSDEDEPDRDVRFRAAHLAPDTGAVDLYLGDDTSGSPDATLSYGDASETIRVESGVYRVQITPAGGSDVIYDSDPVLGWETGDDLLLAVMPATGVQASDDSELSLIEVDGEQSRRIPDEGQQAELALVNASGNSVDFAAQDGTFSRSDIASIGQEPDGGGYVPEIAARNYSVDFEVDNDTCDYCYGIGLKQGSAGTLVLRELPTESTESATTSFLTNDARPVATNARVRIANAVSERREALDVYLIGSGCGATNSLPEEGVIPEPIVSGLRYPNRSPMLPVPEASEDGHQLVVTTHGNPDNELLCESVDPEIRGIHELILAQEPESDGGDNPLELIQVGDVR